MARDFKAKGKDKRAGGFGSSLSFITGLLIGLTVAVVIYFTRVCGPGDESDTSFPLAPAPALAPSEPEAVVQDDHSALAPAASSGAPAFDFYKILPGVEVKVPEIELTTPPPPPPETPAESPAAAEAYVLQVGSFQKFADADQAKAQLALQGVSSTIQRVVVDGTKVWFRVHVGPYTNMADVQAMRSRLTQAGASVVVLRIGGGRP